MNIKLKTLKSGEVVLHLHGPFRISQGGYWHFGILTLSISKEGCGFQVLGISIGVGWYE